METAQKPRNSSGWICNTNSILASASLHPEDLLKHAHQVIILVPNGKNPNNLGVKDRDLRVGVDLGTAYTVLVVLDEQGIILAGEYHFTQVLRDGLVVDYFEVVDILCSIKNYIEARLEQPLTHAASGYPPGIHQAEVRTTANVIKVAGIDCNTMVDEPSAANQVLTSTIALSLISVAEQPALP